MGIYHDHDILTDDGDDEEKRKLRAFIFDDGVAFGIIDQMVEHWRGWCQSHYSSRMIVMADDTKQAARISSYLHSRHNINCTLATSKEDMAGRRIKHFREKREGRCLVTVAMAYIGFDCPDLTHLAYLSTTRAATWLLQSFARVNRFDRNAPLDYDHQHAFVFAPDDKRMRVFMSWMREQQEVGVRERVKRFAPSPDGTMPIRSDIEPVSATLGATAIESLEGRIAPETKHYLDKLAKECPSFEGMPYHRMLDIVRYFGDKDHKPS
jgi:superfamily II DNA or RNA helicase